ncbi:hypothetical protein B0H11DRAFT_2186133 [Mycena galericulata]|nr:hypothetical protein B0H11DRAFT_2186133 [Mycena galericulata]
MILPLNFNQTRLERVEKLHGCYMIILGITDSAYPAVTLWPARPKNSPSSWAKDWGDLGLVEAIRMDCGFIGFRLVVEEIWRTQVGEQNDAKPATASYFASSNKNKTFSSCRGLQTVSPTTPSLVCGNSCLSPQSSLALFYSPAVPYFLSRYSSALRQAIPTQNFPVLRLNPPAHAGPQGLKTHQDSFRISSLQFFTNLVLVQDLRGFRGLNLQDLDYPSSCLPVFPFSAFLFPAPKQDNVSTSARAPRRSLLLQHEPRRPTAAHTRKNLTPRTSVLIRSMSRRAQRLSPPSSKGSCTPTRRGRLSPDPTERPGPVTIGVFVPYRDPLPPPPNAEVLGGGNVQCNSGETAWPQRRTR